MHGMHYLTIAATIDAVVKQAKQMFFDSHNKICYKSKEI